jgi:hypothetical protein
LAEVQEPGCASGKARSRGGLGQGRMAVTNPRIFTG